MQPLRPGLNAPQGMREARGLLGMPGRGPERWSGHRVLSIPARRLACSLCRETALYGNLILKKGVLAPKDLC